MPISIHRTIQFAETDMAGVLHFSNYFRLMEEVEHAFWRSIGLSVYMGGREPDISWPRVAVACEYRLPARFEDTIELRHRLTHIGNRSVEHAVDFYRDGERIAGGTMKTVCCAMTPTGFRAITIPAVVRDKLEPHLAADRTAG
ncbi:MAG: hypothetical protein AMXMBFR47_18340 [Planctomycetota bacterium]